MTADVADGERRGVGRAERIGTITIVKGGLMRLRRAGLPALALGGGIFAATWVLQAIVTAVGVDPAVPGMSLAHVGFAFATAMLAGLGSALAFRLFIEGPRRLLRFDRPLLECAAIMGGLTFMFSGGQMVFTAASRGLAPGAATVSGFVLMAAYLLAFYVLLRVTLWPICRLAGRTDIGLGQAWRLMRKATRGLLFGYLIFTIPFVVVFVSNWSALTRGGGQRGEAAQALLLAVGAAYGMACYAMSATVYALRVENPATVADVFD